MPWAPPMGHPGDMDPNGGKLAIATGKPARGQCGLTNLVPATMLTAIRVFSLIFLVAIATGCGPRPRARQTTTDHGALDTAKVLAIAREALRTNDTWLDRAEFETPKREPDGSWTVLAWRRPATPGGHRFITIDAGGKVTDYGRGL